MQHAAQQFPLSAEQTGQNHGVLEIEMRVMLVGYADPTVELDVRIRIGCCRLVGEMLGRIEVDQRILTGLPSAPLRRTTTAHARPQA